MEPKCTKMHLVAGLRWDLLGILKHSPGPLAVPVGGDVGGEVFRE